jgi:hypothetical protein
MRIFELIPKLVQRLVQRLGDVMNHEIPTFDHAATVCLEMTMGSKGSYWTVLLALSELVS